MIAIALALLAQAAPSRPPADIWQMKCTLCHGEDGKSQTRKGRQLKAPNFTGDRWQKHTTDQEIVEAIADGVPKRKMPSFKGKLTVEEIQSMVPYLRAFAVKK